MRPLPGEETSLETDVLRMPGEGGNDYGLGGNSVDQVGKGRKKK